MATIKETRITDKTLTIGIDEFDTGIITVTMSANTRQSDGTLINTYQKDITDLFNDEIREALTAILLRATQKVMTDRKITTTDLAEGHKNKPVFPPNAPVIPGPPPRTMTGKADELPPVIDPDEVQRKHFEEHEAHQKEIETQVAAALEEQDRQRREHLQRLEEEEQQRLKDEGARYEQQQIRAQKESARIERRKTQQRKAADKDAPASHIRRVTPRSRPTK